MFIAVDLLHVVERGKHLMSWIEYIFPSFTRYTVITTITG